MNSQRAYREYNYMPFIVFMRTQKGGKLGKLHRPKRNYTFNRIAVPSDYIMNGGKIKEVKNYENTVQTIQNHKYIFKRQIMERR